MEGFRSCRGAPCWAAAETRWQVDPGNDVCSFGLSQSQAFESASCCSLKKRTASFHILILPLLLLHVLPLFPSHFLLVLFSSIFIFLYFSHLYLYLCPVSFFLFFSLPFSFSFFLTLVLFHFLLLHSFSFTTSSSFSLFYPFFSSFLPFVVFHPSFLPLVLLFSYFSSLSSFSKINSFSLLLFASPPSSPFHTFLNYFNVFANICTPRAPLLSGWASDGVEVEGVPGRRTTKEWRQGGCREGG